MVSQKGGGKGEFAGVQCCVSTCVAKVLNVQVCAAGRQQAPQSSQ